MALMSVNWIKILSCINMHEIKRHLFQAAVEKKHCCTDTGENEETSTYREISIAYAEPIIDNDYGLDDETATSWFEQEQKAKSDTQGHCRESPTVVEENSDSGSLGLPLELRGPSDGSKPNEPRTPPDSADPDQSLVNKRVESLDGYTNVTGVHVEDRLCGNNCSSNSSSMELLEKVSILDGEKMDPGMSHLVQGRYSQILACLYISRDSLQLPTCYMSLF